MEPILLAYLGIALMTGLTFIGSSYGVTILHRIKCVAFFTGFVRIRGLFHDAEIPG